MFLVCVEPACDKVELYREIAGWEEKNDGAFPFSSQKLAFTRIVNKKIKATSGCGQPSASQPLSDYQPGNFNLLLRESPVLRPLFCGRTAQVVQERIPSEREECEIAVGFGLDVLDFWCIVRYV